MFSRIDILFSSATSGVSNASVHSLLYWLDACILTPLASAVPNCCCSKGPAPYWSNPPFLIFVVYFDIRALWPSGLSARAPECQKIKMVGETTMAKCKMLMGSAVKGLKSVAVCASFD